MAPPDQPPRRPRNIGRRKEDRLVRERIRKHDYLFEVGRSITSTLDFDVLFEVVMAQTNRIMDCQRSTVFLFDQKSSQLFTLVATGLKKNEVRIPADHGIAGWVFQNRLPLISNDAYSDPRFFPDVDTRTGFKTDSILCVPLISKQKTCIGVLQALNKTTEKFSDEDLKLLISVSHYVAIACENATLYEELKILDKAKERVINHLAHELKTPLAIISAVIDKFARVHEESENVKLDRAIRRGRRNLDRLLDLQEKIDDILNQQTPPERELILRLIEDAAMFVDEMAEKEFSDTTAFLHKVSQRIQSIYSIQAPRIETLEFSRLLNQMADRTLSLMGPRDLTLVRNIEADLFVKMDRRVLEKVCTGLLKNAVENTPDEGAIAINAGSRGNAIGVEFHDFGVGITEPNRKLIFGGFFHTQDTDMYASKKPYEFNAGGSGSDLLRTKVFSERYGFSIAFDSSRCRFLPADRDVCPGRISACPFITEAAECLTSGGTLFTLKLPAV